MSFSVTGSARETQLSSVSQNNSFLVLCRVWLALRRCLPPHSSLQLKGLWTGNEFSQRKDLETPGCWGQVIAGLYVVWPTDRRRPCSPYCTNIPLVDPWVNPRWWACLCATWTEGESLLIISLVSFLKENLKPPWYTWKTWKDTKALCWTQQETLP